MKKIILAVAMVALMSTTLVSCRNYDADNGMYSYYNDSVRDRNKENSVDQNTKNRIKNSYNKAKENVKNGFESATNYIGNAMGVR